jgi:hypothetical protein
VARRGQRAHSDREQGGQSAPCADLGDRAPGPSRRADLPPRSAPAGAVAQRWRSGQRRAAGRRTKMEHRARQPYGP